MLAPPLDPPLQKIKDRATRTPLKKGENSDDLYHYKFTHDINVSAPEVASKF
jgi:hypothetical protein